MAHTAKTDPRRRHGFSLAEVLVVLAIVSVMAGVLIPVVTGQVRKSQVSRITADLNNLRTSAQAFATDVHRLPADLEDLAAQIGSGDTDLEGRAYPPGLSTKWEGPYLDKDVADGATLPTGFGGSILDDFEIFTHSNGVPYLTLRTIGLTSVEFQDIDEQLDDGSGTDAGRLRFTAAGDTMKYLAIPITD